MPAKESELRISLNEEVQNLKSQLKIKDKEIKDYRSEHGQLSTLFRELGEQCTALVPNKPIYFKPTKVVIDTPVTAVLQVTDMHMGGVQQSDEIEGFNEFNPEICEARCFKFINNVIKWTTVQRTGYIINDAVVIVTGDLISGDIHDDIRITNAFPSPVQAVRAGELLAKQVSMLSSNFSSVRVEFICEDNHARLTKKPQSKEGGMNTLNYVVGYIAMKLLEKHKNVKFNLYPMYEKVIEIATRRILITHGHGVMAWQGIPWYGIERKVAREALRRMNAPDRTKFEKVVLGHWHTPITTQFFWVGGSVSGTDAFDHKNSRHALPSQCSWLIHPEHGFFNRVDFELN